jgi:hypothetical protein
MQYVDDDMEEFYQRIANDYPLRLPKGDWDAVAGKLADSTTIALPAQLRKGSKPGNYGYWLLTLLLFIVPGMRHAAPKNNQIGNRIENRTEYQQARGELRGKNAVAVEKSNHEVSDPLHRVAGKTKQYEVNCYTESFFSNSKTRLNATEADIIGADDFSHWTYSTKIKIDGTFQNKSTVVHEDERMAQEDLISLKYGEYASNTTIQKDSMAKQTNSSSFVNKQKGFYTGLMVGSQFSQVKNQRINKPGISFGIIAGFHLNKRFAIESGVFVSEKKYFSSGKYFSMNKIAASMPVGMQVISVTGKSTAFEIPVTLKYDLYKKGKGTYFASAGVSSYILTHEKNNYQAMLNGIQEELAGNYQNSQKYFGAAVNMSVGYTVVAGKKALFRIEPYIKIPLKGIGVGSLPVFSAGLHAGITLPFAR